MILEEAVKSLVDIGLADVLLPFLLVFTIVFAILQKSNIIGAQGKNKNFNVIIALVMGFAVIIPHVTRAYPAGWDVVEIINSALPSISLVAVAIVMALILIGVFGKEWQPTGKAFSWVVGLAFAIVLLIFAVAVGGWRMPRWLYFLNDPDLQTAVIVILIFALIIWFVTKSDTGGETTSASTEGGTE